MLCTCETGTHRKGPKLPAASLIAIASQYFLIRNVIDTALIYVRSRGFYAEFPSMPML